MAEFHDKQRKWKHHQCDVCHETWPNRSNSVSEHYICLRCKRDKRQIKLFSDQNDMDPGKVPPSLEGLSQIEEMLIARVCPIMCVFRLKGGQRGYNGHVLNLPQDLQGFLDKLPCHVSDLPVILIRRHGSDNTHRDCRVRRASVLAALLWLKQNNPFYRDVEIDTSALNSLPEDGIPEDLLNVEERPNSADHGNETPLEQHEETATSICEAQILLMHVIYFQ